MGFRPITDDEIADGSAPAVDFSAPQFDQGGATVIPINAPKVPRFRAITDDEIAPPSFGDAINSQAGFGSKLASGALSGIAGLGDFASMISDYITGAGLSRGIAGKITGQPTQSEPTLGDYARRGFDAATGVPNSTQIGADSLPHEIGSFLPAMIGDEFSALPVAKNLLAATLAGTGGYGGKVIGGTPGEIIGSLAPATITGLASKLTGAASSGADLIANLSKSPEEIAAAKLAPSESAIMRMATESENPLYKFQTVAEATQDPYLAQLQDSLGKSSTDLNARLVDNTKARQLAQLDLLGQLSESPKLSAEAGGATLRDVLQEAKIGTNENIGKLYDALPKDVPVDLSPIKTATSGILSDMYEAGGAPSKLRGIQSELARTDYKDVAPFSYVKSLRDRAQDAWVDLKNSGDRRGAKAANDIIQQIDASIARSPNADAFALAKSKYSEFAKKFQGGPVGNTLSGLSEGNYRTPASAVVDRAFNGTAENTRAILEALPGDEGSLDQFRGVLRDKIIRDNLNNDGYLKPGRFRTYLRENMDGLTATTKDGQPLFEPEHLKIVDQVAKDLSFLDTQSESSVKQLANQASKGQPTTAQAIFMKDVGAKALEKAIPGGKLLRKIGSSFLEADQSKAEEMLSKALFDKDYAKLLVSKATPDSVGMARRILGGVDALASALDYPFAGGSRLVGAIPPSLSALSSSARGPEGDTSASGQAPPALPALLGGSKRASALAPGSQQSKEAAKSPYIYSLLKSPSTQALISEVKTGKRNASDFISSAMDRAEAKKSGQAKDAVLGDSPLKELADKVQKQESGGKASAVSNKGAVGLMQIMPDTGKQIAKDLGIEKYDLKDAKTNRLFGEYYLAKLLDQFDGDKKLALAAYNAGPATVKNWLKVYGNSWDEIAPKLRRQGSYKETLDYVRALA